MFLVASVSLKEHKKVSSFCFWSGFEKSAWLLDFLNQADFFQKQPTPAKKDQWSVIVFALQ